MTLVLCEDNVTVSNMTPGMYAYAGYGNGPYANMSAIRRRFPGKKYISVATSASGSYWVYDAIDIEPGTVGSTQASSFPKAVTFIRNWTKAKADNHHDRPIVYVMGSWIRPLVSYLTSHGIARDRYYLWTAHWGWQHICGPTTCGLSPVNADGTQYIGDNSSVTGRNIDRSIFQSYVFGSGAAPVNTTHPVKNAAGSILRPGDTGAAVKTMQEDLDKFGYKLTVDGDYGTRTEAALRDFQRHQKLPINSVVDATVWARLTGKAPVKVAPKPSRAPAWPATEVLKPGSKGDAVTVLQSYLRGSGAYGARGISVDGDFGSQTETALRNYQAAKHLTVDGIAGPATRRALGVK